MRIVLQLVGDGVSVASKHGRDAIWEFEADGRAGVHVVVAVVLVHRHIAEPPDGLVAHPAINCRHPVFYVKLLRGKEWG